MNTDDLRARVRHALKAIHPNDTAGAALGEPGGHGLPASTPLTG